MWDFSKSGDSTQSEMIRRMSESDFLQNEKLNFKGDLLSQRPTTNTSSRKGVYSSDGKAKSFIFRKRDILNNRERIQNG